jgi:hypothetical protein
MSKAPASPVGRSVLHRPPLALYNGSGRIEALQAYRRVVLRPWAYSPDELAELRRGGTEPVAYLSLSEDQGPPAPWQCTRRNRDRGTVLVHLDHPGWAEHLVSQAERALDAGFAGLFLDGLNTEWAHPRDLPQLLQLIAALRERSGPGYLLANGGFAMLPRLAELVDGVLFDSFSARHVDGRCEPWPADVLDAHARLAERLLGFDLNLYTLDYADDDALAAFAVRRARQYGMSCFVSDQALSRLPEVVPAL